LRKQNPFLSITWILFPRNTLGEVPKRDFCKKCFKFNVMATYGFCFRQTRWVKFPNGLKSLWILFPPNTLGEVPGLFRIFLFWNTISFSDDVTWVTSYNVREVWLILYQLHMTSSSHTPRWRSMTSPKMKNLVLDFVSVKHARWYSQNVANKG